MVNNVIYEQLNGKFDDFNHQSIVKQTLYRETYYKQNNNGFHYSNQNEKIDLLFLCFK